jgi:HEAT repeat protein
MWDQHPREKEIWREYRARLTLEKTDELPLFLLEVLLKGWWGPVPGDWEAPGWGDVHRYQAVILLGKLKEKRAYEPLLALFQDEKQNEFLRAHAARGLGLLGDPRALPPLREAFLAGAKQVPPEVWQSERARVGLLVYDLINNLIRGIAPNWIVAEAGLALKQMRGPEAVTAWGEWLKSEDPQRRLLAVDFLREIGDASALPALKEAAANDQNTQVREAAEAAVRQMEER